jgi:hypothetical protein
MVDVVEGIFPYCKSGRGYIVAPPGYCEREFHAYITHLFHQNCESDPVTVFRSLHDAKVERRTQTTTSTLLDLCVEAEGARGKDVWSQWTLPAKDFCTIFKHGIENRNVCTTSSGKLGLCSKSAGAGDEVWLIRGHRSPVELRLHESSQGYTFIGDAYIHGIMYGELMSEELEASLQQIALI